MRKMVYIRIIDEINDIEGADNIQVATVGGWKCVVKRDEFKAGDFAVFHEIDCWLPFSNPAYSFLMKPEGENKIFDGIEGVRLRTIKLRGQISQGLLLPLSAMLDCDLSGLLGVTKWEKYLNTCTSTKPKGNFPFFIPKTDQERVQNLKSDIKKWAEAGNKYEITEKLDGSSCTIYFKDGEIGVCSRNLELQRDEDNQFWKVITKHALEDKLKSFGHNIAIQGELTGFNIQGNPYKYSQGEYHFHVFDIFDIDNQVYLGADARYNAVSTLGLEHCPVLNTGSKLSEMDPLLKFAEGKSELNKETEREGVVFKNINDPSQSFKVISNKFLLKNGE